MSPTLTGFARSYFRRKLVAAGVSVTDADLDNLVRVTRQNVAGESDGEGVVSTSSSQTGRGPHRLIRYAVFFRRADLSVELNANTGEAMSWLCGALAEGNTALPPADAMRVAQTAATPPANAVLVQGEYEDVGGSPVFVAHWEHREDGVLVEHDYFRVLVGGHSGRVFAVQQRWHQVDFNPSER